METGVGSEEEAERLLQTDLGWGRYFLRREQRNSTDLVAERVSDRMERATTMRVDSPLSAESFQV